MDGERLIEVRKLTKKFGRITALDEVSLDIYRGEIFGLLGPNGAGKSTFISILTTLCKPTSGEVFTAGFDISKEPDKIKNSIGFVPQDIALYQMLSGMDNLNFWAGIYGIKGKLKKDRIEEALLITQLEKRIYDRVENYSGGMKRRLNIAVSLLHHPEILVMDEPTVGVDVVSRRFIFDAILDLKKKNKTIIFTSHNIDEMESSCDRLAIIDKGKIDAIGTAEELKEKYGKDKIEDIMFEFLKNC
jgi:ABC-2 type transport system ATP-binding protein